MRECKGRQSSGMTQRDSDGTVASRIFGKTLNVRHNTQGTDLGKLSYHHAQVT